MSLRDRFKAISDQGLPNFHLQAAMSAAKPKLPDGEALQRAVGRPPSGKVRVTMLLEPDVVEKFRATGPGWQARMNDVLKAARPEP